jgi:hypothetical protein
MSRASPRVFALAEDAELTGFESGMTVLVS